MMDLTSEGRLTKVHPDLVRVVRRAHDTCTQPFIVIQGVRTHDEMCVNWGKGRTALECTSAGVPAGYAQPHLAKVTWLRDPFMSNHRMMPDGYGHAVDLGATVNGKYDGQTVHLYDTIAAAMMAAAKELGVKIRWLGDANMNGIAHEKGEADMAHFELLQ